MGLLGRGDLVVQECLLKGCETLLFGWQRSVPMSESCVYLRSRQMLMLPGGLAML